jgi:hypothetical protein
MILGASTPIANEPNFSFDDGMATEHRNHVQCTTVLCAMLFWLESEKAKKSVWKDISVRYWLHNGRRVLDNVRRCSRSNTLLRRAYEKRIDGSVSFSARGMGKRWVDLVSMLEKALGSLGTGIDDQGQTKYRY